VSFCTRTAIALAASALAAAAISAAEADGMRSLSARHAAGYAASGLSVTYGIGAISRNVITPWYVGYYPWKYSYYRPDPMPPPVYHIRAGCWCWIDGEAYWAC
jgi:hypothetical protein